MYRASLVIAALSTVGCQAFEDFQDTVDGYTNPLVAQGLFLGIEAPNDVLIDASMLEQSDFSESAYLQVFLADAADFQNLDEAPVQSGELKIRVGDNASVELTKIESGLYEATSADGLQYEVGANTHITLSTDNAEGSLSAKSPEAPVLSLEFLHAPDTVMGIDLRDHNFDGALAVVVDAATGETTWTNQPQTIEDLYTFTHADGAIDRLEIPAEAFPHETVYAVGIAGLEIADTANLEGVNIALSAYMTGQITFQSVCTLEADICDTLWSQGYVPGS